MVATHNSTSRRRKKKKLDGLVNIFKVFEDKRRTYELGELTPRSAEACNLTGIIPEEVRPRDLISFQAKGVSENVQKMRFVDYTETRMELQERLTDVRDECIARRPASRSSKEGGTHLNNQGDPASKTASGAQAMVEREKKQLKIMRDRQRKEVEQMLAYEMKQVELAESANRRLESDRKRFEQMELVKKERLMRQAKQKRFAELAKRATREVEEQYRKKQAQVIARRDKEAAELKVKQEQQRIKEAEERNDLRKQKVEDLRELAQAKHAVRETILVDKRRNMERQEVERKRQMLQQQEIMQAALAQRREEAERRVKTNAKRVERVIKLQGQRARRKDRLVEARQLRAKAQTMAEKEGLDLEKEIREKRRELILADTLDQKAKRVEQLIWKAEEDNTLEIVRAKLDRELIEKREQATINRERKTKNIQRRLRREEYKRQLMHDQQERDAERVHALDAQKLDLLKRRQQLRIDSKRAKDQVLTAMDRIRVQKNWAGAEKLLLQKLA